MAIWINILIVFLIYLFILKKKNRSNILILLVSISFSGYSGIIPGLKFIDIISILIFIIYFKSIKKIGVISVSLFVMMMYQIVVNTFFLSINKFVGTLGDCFITPLHEFLPLILLFLVFENIPLDFQKLLGVYYRFLVFVLVILVVFIFLNTFLNIFSVKVISPFVGLAGLISFLSPIYIYIKLKVKFTWGIVNVIFISFCILILSDVRGALLVYVILLGIVLILNGNKLFIFTVTCVVFISSPILYKLVKSSEEIMSIIELQTSLLLEKSPDFNILTSSEILRYQLWTAAKDVWLENFWFGIGTNQFQMLGILNRDEQLSPHHVIFSVTSDGGVVALTLVLLPIIVFLVKSLFKYKNLDFINLKKILLITSLLYVLMGYLLGYTFELNFLLVLILVIFTSSTKKSINT